MGELIHTHKQRRCDFCGRTQDQAEYLIVSSGEAADICEACVELCVGILATKRADKAANPQPKDDR